jgi:hypothetical protein
MKPIEKFSTFFNETSSMNKAIREEEEKTKHATKFVELLKKYKVDSPAELSDEEKSKFFNELKGKKTEPVKENEKIELYPATAPTVPTAKEDTANQIAIDLEELSDEDLAKEIEKEILALGEPDDLEDDEDLQESLVLPTFDEFFENL